MLMRLFSSETSSTTVSQATQANPHRGLRPNFARGLHNSLNNDSSKTRMLMGICEEPLVSPAYMSAADSNGERGASQTASSRPSSSAVPALRLRSGGTIGNEAAYNVAAPKLNFKTFANPPEASHPSTPRRPLRDLPVSANPSAASHFLTPRRPLADILVLGDPPEASHPSTPRRPLNDFLVSAHSPETSFSSTPRRPQTSVPSTPRRRVSDLVGTEADLALPQAQQPQSARTRPRRVFATSLGASLSARDRALREHEDAGMRAARQTSGSSVSSMSLGSKRHRNTFPPGWLASGSTSPSVLGTSVADRKSVV